MGEDNADRKVLLNKQNICTTTANCKNNIAKL